MAHKLFTIVFIVCTVLLLISILLLALKVWRENHESWKEKAKLEEKELAFSLEVVKSIDQFNHWLFKYDDDVFVMKYKNDESGSVSAERLASLKLYDQFIDLDENFFKIRKGVYNLPTSFFSRLSMEANEEIIKIEESKKLMMEALKRRHITPDEAIMTVRTKMKDFYRLISLPLSEISILDRFAIENENNESLVLIKELNHKIKITKDDNSTYEHVKDSIVKESRKVKIRKYKNLIRDEKEKIRFRSKDFKLRNYLAKNGMIQKIAREYLLYLEEVKKPFDENQQTK